MAVESRTASFSDADAFALAWFVGITATIADVDALTPLPRYPQLSPSFTDADAVISYSGAQSLTALTIYRVSLAGDLWFQVSSVSLRRPQSGNYLNVVCPAVDSDLIDSVIARDGESLVLWRGVKGSDGTEQLAEMASVPLSEYRYDRGASSASLTLAGRSQAAYPATSQRPVSEITYRNISETGRRVRCAINTDLIPGDTVDLGAGETFVVDSVVITITPSLSSMEVSEG